MVGACLIFEGGGHKDKYKDKYKDKDIKMVGAGLIYEGGGERNGWSLSNI